MEYSYYKIDPTGNITAIVETKAERCEQSRIAGLIMAADKTIEQVGFLEKPHSVASVRLQMMGGEFCGNASISAAALMAQKGGISDGDITLEVSGADEPLCVKVRKLDENRYLGTVAMPLPLRIEALDLDSYRLPCIHFSGISHVICGDALSVSDAESNIRSWCKRLNIDALGLMFLNGDTLKPYVYVRSTDTAVWESSCASGSTACAAYLAASSGKSQEVTLRNPGGTLAVTAELSGGELSALNLTGSAEITGMYRLDKPSCV